MKPAEPTPLRAGQVWAHRVHPRTLVLGRAVMGDRWRALRRDSDGNAQTIVIGGEALRAAYTLKRDPSAEGKAPPRIRMRFVPEAPPLAPLTKPSGLLEALCDEFAICVKALLGPSRSALICQARFAAIWLLREGFALSLPETGRTLHRDHSTCLYGYRRALHLRGSDARFYNLTERLMARLREAQGLPVDVKPPNLVALAEAMPV